MTNIDQSLWVVQNGEIYNFEELRRELRDAGYIFRSDCDTEVLLHGYAHWGRKFVRLLRGMFALAIWSEKEQQLLLARDRFGIKPLYYRMERRGKGFSFTFSSEIRPILSNQSAASAPNLPLVYDFLRFGLLEHTSDTFFEGIVKLPPAHYMIVGREGSVEIERYWDFQVNPEVGTVSRKNDKREAQAFRQAFMESLRHHLVSDVPIGSCLSGGLDSSAIVSGVDKLLRDGEGRAPADGRQLTFTSCFDDPRFDERRFVNQVLADVPARGNFVFPTPSGFLQELPQLLYHQEEPFSGTSVYAQWCLMREIRRAGLKVVLDGQGADEQLLGYGKFYLFYLRVLARQQRYAAFIREGLALGLAHEFWRSLDVRRGFGYMGRLASLSGGDALVAPSLASRFADRVPEVGLHGSLADRIKLDMTRFSLPVLLRYEDKNSMAFSVEARVPFVDHVLAEYVAGLPVNQKLRSGWTKFVMRQGLKGILPEPIRMRKSKIGFVTPELLWFRGALVPEVERTFASAQFLEEWADLPRLRQAFANYQKHPGVISHSIFFRYFIVEKWARQFFLDEGSTSDTPVSVLDEVNTRV